MKWVLNAIRDTLQPNKLMREVEGAHKQLIAECKRVDAREEEVRLREDALDVARRNIEDMQKQLEAKIKENDVEKLRQTLDNKDKAMKSAMSRISRLECEAARFREYPSPSGVLSAMESVAPSEYSERDREIIVGACSMFRHMHEQHTKPTKHRG